MTTTNRRTTPKTTPLAPPLPRPLSPKTAQAAARTKRALRWACRRFSRASGTVMGILRRMTRLPVDLQADERAGYVFNVLQRRNGGLFRPSLLHVRVQASSPPLYRKMDYYRLEIPGFYLHSHFLFSLVQRFCASVNRSLFVKLILIIFDARNS